MTYAEWNAAYTGKWSMTGVNSAELPENVAVMTLMHFDGDLLLRLEHLYGPGESPTLSTDAQVNLENLFAPAGLTVNGFVEMSLGGNVAKSTVQRLQWNTEKKADARARSGDVGMTVTMRPAEIRTFLINVNRA